MIAAMPDIPAAASRAEFAAFRIIPTRWRDNDMFGHVNNATYYSFFDTAITAWLIENGCVNRAEGSLWMVAETGCRFLAEVAFPEILAVGLYVARLGRSSVQYRRGLCREAADEASAVGHFVHVHIDGATRRPSPIPDAIRQKLAVLERAAPGGR